ncbi:MAG: hypothetical protein H0T15_04470 [Thermoleophilaceae bacterium]|nr:hypothetical protein [Thermoleophilaceae bacterium]
MGPAAWIAAAALTWRVLRLPAGRVALATVAGGLVSGIASVAGVHGVGLAAGVLVFGAVIAAAPDRTPVH